MRPAGPADSPGFLLWHVTLRWRRAVGAALRPLELTHVQFVLLASLWWLSTQRRERPSQRALAAHAGTDPMMTSQVLRVLEARGLVARAADPADARARLLDVTPAGARLAEHAIAVVEAADAAFFAPVPDAGELLRTLRVLGSGAPPAGGDRVGAARR